MVTFLSGGTGTPKLLWGAADVFDLTESAVIVNTGDDVEFGGLHVSPDIDTVIFERAGLLDREKWWGIHADPTVTSDYARELTEAVGLPSDPVYLSEPAQTSGRRLSDWRRFSDIPPFMTIGDRDRAHHMVRTRMLDAGHTLTETTRALARAYDLRIDVLPMSDDPVATIIETAEGEMHFQEYWVGRQGTPEVTGVTFRGGESASGTSDVRRAIQQPVVIGPANPVTSIGPMLEIESIAAGLRDTPVVAVSPFIEDTVFSGPAGDLMRGIGQSPSTRGVAESLSMVDAFVLDRDDGTRLDRHTEQTDTRIDTQADATRVANACKRAVEAVSDV